MRKTRSLMTVLMVLGSVVALAACGSSSKSSSSSGGTASTGGKEGGTITIVSGTAPLSADQGLDFTTQGNQLYSVIDTPLLTFVRGVEGTAGSQIIPALAKGLPTVSKDGLTYTFVLRPNLHYSNGQAIK